MNTKVDESLLDGPPIRSITTPYDRALMCLEGKIERQFTFAVGAILDRTGREQFTLGGQGKYVIQGAGDIVQSALFKTGVTLLNRQDPRVMETDFKWGLRNSKSVVPVDFFVTGSINSLDFLPGGGADISVDGVGPSYMSNRILVGLDMSVTQAKTGRILASVALQKQISTKEFNLGVGRFFGGSLVSLSAGFGRRETLQFVQRQMLNLAIFELMSQLLTPPKYDACVDEIAELGTLDSNLRSVRDLLAYRKSKAQAVGQALPSNIEADGNEALPTLSARQASNRDADQGGSPSFEEPPSTTRLDPGVSISGQSKNTLSGVRSESDAGDTENRSPQQINQVGSTSSKLPARQTSPSADPSFDQGAVQQRKDKILRY